MRAEGDTITVTRAELAKLVEDGVCSALDRSRNIDRQTHWDDHEFIRLLKQREKRRVERWERIRTTVIGGAILLALSGIGSLLYNLGKLALKGLERGP